MIDARQGQGLGTELLRRLVQMGRNEGLSRIIATVPSTMGPRRSLRKVGFTVRRDDAEQLMKAELNL